MRALEFLKTVDIAEMRRELDSLTAQMKSTQSSFERDISGLAKLIDAAESVQGVAYGTSENQPEPCQCCEDIKPVATKIPMPEIIIDKTIAPGSWALVSHQELHLRRNGVAVPLKPLRKPDGRVKSDDGIPLRVKLLDYLRSHGPSRVAQIARDLKLDTSSSLPGTLADNHCFEKSGNFWQLRVEKPKSVETTDAAEKIVTYLQAAGRSSAMAIGQGIGLPQPRDAVAILEQDSRFVRVDGNKWEICGS